MGSIARAFLLFFFKQLYTTLAWGYDFVAFTSSMGQWATWRRVAIDGLAEGRILELGFGTGHLLLELSRKRDSVIGVDSSSQMTQIAHRRFLQHDSSARAILAKAQTLPFAYSSFQIVLSTFPSDYIFERSTLAEIYRVLKSGGTLIIVPGVARITGPRDQRIGLIWIADKLSSLVYRITGESNDADEQWHAKVTSQLSEIGFSVVFERIILPRAEVVKITAMKEHNHK